MVFVGIGFSLRQIKNNFLVEKYYFFKKIILLLHPLNKNFILRLIVTAGVAKLVDASDLGSDSARCVGSSPSARTKQ